MRLLIRVDGGPQIGGGHVMRCLTLANAARAQGHEVVFVMANAVGATLAPVQHAGFDLHLLPPRDHMPEAAPPHAGWLSLPWAEDAALSAAIASTCQPDWIIYDHYGLDARWVGVIRRAVPRARVMAIDDVDDRPLGADLLLDQTRLVGTPQHGAIVVLNGPRYALLRPEFAALRPSALARRAQATQVKRILVAPGMMDAVGLAPMALRALQGLDVEIDVVMGSASQSREQTAALIVAMPRATLMLDATDMANRMAAADLCIGAGGMTSWERCALGLPAVLVPVADNQRAVTAELARAGAAIEAPLPLVRNTDAFRALIITAMDAVPNLTAGAAALCDGAGAARVMVALGGHLRPVTRDDAQMLFDWRNQPRIRQVSLDPAPLIWDQHLSWLERVLTRQDGLWLIYAEEDRPLGHINAVDQGDGRWRWGFYIGAADSPPGAGRRMLAAILTLMAARDDITVIEAEVMPGNLRSLDLHRALGFVQYAATDGGPLVMRLALCDVKISLGLDEGNQ